MHLCFIVACMSHRITKCALKKIVTRISCIILLFFVLVAYQITVWALNIFSPRSHMDHCSPLVACHAM